MGDDAGAALGGLSYGALTHVARYLPHAVGRPDALRRAIAALLWRHAPRRCDLAVELGCSVGPDLRTLRRHAAEVIGLDSYVVPLRAARRLLDGHPVPLPVRREGRAFELDTEVSAPAVTGVHLAVGSALDPPLKPECAQIVAAINLLDNVAEPLNLLGQMDALLQPGGLMLLASPFHWQEAITPAAEQLGGGTIPGFNRLGSCQALEEVLSGRTPWLQQLDYEILERRDAPWTLRDHDRAETRYLVHVMAARKLPLSRR